MTYPFPADHSHFAGSCTAVKPAGFRNPGMIGVGDEATFAQEPGHDVETIRLIPIGGAARTVAARHQNYVAFGYSGRLFLPNPVDNVATNVDVSQKTFCEEARKRLRRKVCVRGLTPCVSVVVRRRDDACFALGF